MKFLINTNIKERDPFPYLYLQEWIQLNIINSYKYIITYNRHELISLTSLKNHYVLLKKKEKSLCFILL